MSSATSTFLLEAVNFLLLAAALRWLLFQPVRNQLEARAKQLGDEDREAAERLENAKKLDAEAQQRHDALEEEFEKLRGERLEAAKAEADKIVADARAAAAKESEALDRRLGQFEASQVERMSVASAAAAAAALRTLLERIEGPDLDGALLRSAASQAASLAHEGGGRVVVRSAKPLPDEARNALAVALKRKPEDLELAVDEGLGPGLRIEAPDGIVDASARGLAGSLESSLRERLAAGDDLEKAS